MREVCLIDKVSNVYLKNKQHLSLIIFVGHLFMEEDDRGSDNPGGDCVNKLLQVVVVGASAACFSG